MAGIVQVFGSHRQIRLLLGGVLLLLAACRVDLYTQLSEREANKMVAVLAEHGIAAHKIRAADQTLTVQVDETRFAEAVDLLDGFGLPGDKFQTLGEVFEPKGLVSSPVEERARLIYALSQELSQTVSDISGVLSARVHVVLPNADAMAGNPPPSSASVVVHHYADRDLGNLIPQIKMLVANSIEGLVYDNVSVVLFPVEPPKPVPAQPTLAGVTGAWSALGGSSLLPIALVALGAVALAALIGNGVQFWLRRR
jgi:type III secretion protein J